MTFTPAKPRYTLPLAGKEYELEGSFALIEAVEYTLKDNIVSIAVRATSMPAYEMARLIAALLATCGEKVTHREVGDILWNEVGVTSADYAKLCLHVHAALRIFMAKPADRDAEKKRMGELLGGASASPGQTTSDSA